LPIVLQSGGHRYLRTADYGKGAAPADGQAKLYLRSSKNILTTCPPCFTREVTAAFFHNPFGFQPPRLCC
jgi:hypothetical protein